MIGNLAHRILASLRLGKLFSALCDLPKYVIPESRAAARVTDSALSVRSHVKRYGTKVYCSRSKSLKAVVNENCSACFKSDVHKDSCLVGQAAVSI